MKEIHISISPENLFQIGNIQISNSVFTTLIVSTIIIFIALLIKVRIQTVPGKTQSIGELLIETMYGMVESVSPHHAKEFFPYIMTFFIFILLSNLFGLLPGVGTVGFHETIDGQVKMIPLIRPPTADLNTTLALALISVGMTQYFGLKHLGVKLHVGKYLNFKSPIDFFVGILELVAEIAKLISFSFRLFGNVFAGEVLLAVMLALVPIIVPLPFFGLELFAGFIQAVVFSVLTLVFWSLAVEKTH